MAATIRPMGRKIRRRLFLVSEVADTIGVHPSNVRRLIHEGRLRAHRLGDKGSRWRVSAADLERFLSSTMIGAGWIARAVWRPIR